ncbi:hypothetical protein AMD27_01545 [Acinetobacter sp. TGL-Y2]|nr:hypothetical protein AMD27_01545 [Acinetobacter sp. TGL-Y2]
MGFNLYSTKNTLINFSLIFLFLGLVSALLANIQWLGFSQNQNYILGLVGNRPYANFAQPNHLATFLFLSLISLYYLFEKNKIRPLFSLILSFFLIWGIVLTQSRTAWIVIFFIPLFLLFKSKKMSLNIKKIQLAGIFSLFWLMVISLPYVNQLLAPYFNIAQSSTLIERATTGHLRLNIWNQMIHAIWEKPWFGYGWGQTTAAQYAVIDRYPGTEWASSAHNILLDILVWCGIPLGLLIIGYFAYLYFSFFFKSKSIETVCATLMISAVLIHAMLEYPLHYAYFLLPVGFLCGICLAEQKVKTFKISNKWGYLIVLIGFGLLYQVFKEYDQITDNMVAANTHEMNEFKTELILPYDSIFFDKFEDRAKWIAQYPYMEVDQKTLDLAERNLNAYLTSYDLHKYATLLAHNGDKEKAIRQLKILKIMYDEDVSYESLFIKKPSVNVPLETNSPTNN